MNLEDLNVEKELKIIYMGTPEFSATVLEGLLKEYKIRAIVTQPDRSSGREDKVKYSPVKEVAIKNRNVNDKQSSCYKNKKLSFKY